MNSESKICQNCPDFVPELACGELVESARGHKIEDPAESGIKP